MDAIFNRCSVRSFTDQEVSDHEIDGLMKAAMAAPSAGNQQPWEFYITRDPELKKRLSGVTLYSGPAKEAPVLIIVCRHTEGLRYAASADQDLSACVENILLEATDRGLGSVWMGIAPSQEQSEVTASIIGAPTGIEPFAFVGIGYPAKTPEPRGESRYNPDRVHWI